MSRHTVQNTDGTQTVEESDQPADENGMVRYDEAGRAVLLDPFEVLTENAEDIDLATVPTVEQRLVEAKKAVQVSTEQILGHDVIWMAWRPQNAVLPGDGTITEGYFALGRDMTTQRFVTIFVGGVALLRTFRQLNKPFRATIERKGRTLVFK